MAVFTSLKTRLIIVISGAITILLVVLFMAIVTTARSMLIEHEIKNVSSITRTFSVFVLDTIISGQSLDVEKEYILESYILDFMKKDPYLKYITIYDQDGSLVASSDFLLYTHRNRASVKPPASYTPEITFHRSDNRIVTIDSQYALRTGSKSWGTLVMGYDAAPLMREIRTLFMMLASVAIILVVVLQMLLYLTISQLTKSLTRLSTAVEQIDFDSAHSMHLQDSTDEVGVLAGAINQLQERLQLSKKDILEVQKQVHHAEKLASIGRLASGIAHEINNPLSGIKNCIQTIKKEPEDSQQTATYLDLVCEGLDHIETIVRKLLGFSRNQSSALVAVDVGSEINKILLLLEHKFVSRDVQVINTIETNLPAVSGDPAQIQEVFMNLILNGIDAIDRHGEIRLESRLLGKTLSFMITDTGGGIPEEHLNKVFDPFFTTKEQEMGTGLGLSVALGIVESHGGSISLQSRANEGTTFTVTFPVGTEHENSAD